MRKVKLVEGEYYHIFNRGVDKRVIFQDAQDFERFLISVVEFNVIKPIGSIYENSFRKREQLGNLVPKLGVGGKDTKPLVEIISYCLNPNHFHMIVKQIAEKGIERFMHKLGVGYTNYFNEKNDRNGALFQGSFKSVHIETNEQLIYVSAYVNLNNRVHKIKDSHCRSSWREYMENKSKVGICSKDIILGQFKNKLNYKKIAEATVEDIKSRREEGKELNLE